MGAAYDAMCKNESLESTLNKKNRQLREQKKLLIELAECVITYFNEGETTANDLEKKAKNILNKLNKKK